MPAPPSEKGVVTLVIEIRGVRSLPKLTARLGEIPGVLAVQAGSEALASE